MDTDRQSELLSSVISKQFAQTCNMELSAAWRNSTNLGIMPVWITSSIGGLGSRDNSFLKVKCHVKKYFYTSKNTNIFKKLNIYMMYELKLASVGF